MSREVGPGPAKPEGKRGNALVRRIWATINSSIVQKTAVSVSCVFICALVLLTALTSSLHSAWMRQRIVEDKEDFVTEIANMVDDLFENLSIPLISLANQNSVQWLVKHSGGAYDGTWLDHYQEVETSLSSIHVFYDYIVDVGILDGNSKLLFSLTNSFNYRYPFVESEWFQEAMQQPGTAITVPEGISLETMQPIWVLKTASTPSMQPSFTIRSAPRLPSSFVWKKSLTEPQS